MAIKIKFNNGLQGDECRLYGLTTDARQYFLAQLTVAFEIEKDEEGKEISRQPKIIDGVQQYNEINKRSYPSLEFVLKGYIEREQYDCSAKTLEELGNVIKMAYARIVIIKNLIELKE